MFDGLLDTGASATCITPKIVQSLNLISTGKVKVFGATASAVMNQYKIDLGLRFGNQAIGMDGVVVTEYTSNSSRHSVLIGRDILCRGVLTMDFTGHFSFSV